MADDATFGTFSGEPQAVWLSTPSGGRRMRLIEAFTFTETASGRAWSAPRGLVVDGASIPRALWTFVGSPYTGNYRRASIVHDKACEDYPTDGPDRKAADVMFQLACRAGGCDRRQARLLYLGVRIGSSWTRPMGLDNEDEVRIEPSADDLLVQEAFKIMALELEVTEPAGLGDADPELDVDAVQAVMRLYGLETGRFSVSTKA